MTARRRLPNRRASAPIEPLTIIDDGGAKVAARSESAGREVHITNEELPHDVQPRSGSP